MTMAPTKAIPPASGKGGREGGRGKTYLLLPLLRLLLLLLLLVPTGT